MRTTGTESKVSGVVLAGGTSQRLGRDKAAVPVGGEPLLWRVLGQLSQVTDETLVVTSTGQRSSVLPLIEAARVVTDAYPGTGALGGIFTGLSRAVSPWCVVVACDMPFLNLDLIQHILDLRQGYDAVVPLLRGLPESTHAVYSKACLPYIERRLRDGDLKIARFFNEVRVNYVSQEAIERLDPQHLSFFNVNTQEDLDRAQELAENSP